MHNGHGSQGITRYRSSQSSQASFDPSVLMILIALEQQGLQEKIKLVPMDMADKPAWYKNVYPENMVWLEFKYTHFRVEPFEIIAAT
uniref:Uncharacterized protein n=1 Tax=Arundo donax TaxID=35708 RepID=A0A0A9CQL4_ARUDO